MFNPTQRFNESVMDQVRRGTDFGLAYVAGARIESFDWEDTPGGGKRCVMTMEPCVVVRGHPSPGRATVFVGPRPPVVSVED